MPQEIKPLPVAGYRSQTQAAIDRVNRAKALEEKTLQFLDELKADPDIDPRWLAIGRTEVEQGFMAICRSVFKPDRVVLDDK